MDLLTNGKELRMRLPNLEAGDRVKLRRPKWMAVITNVDYLEKEYPISGSIIDPQERTRWPCRWDLDGRFYGPHLESPLDIVKPI
jgi:hypothetical protein